MGKRRKKKITQKQLAGVATEDDGKSSNPKSFVLHRGTVGKSVLELVSNMRTVLSPETAAKLKESKKNQMKDFLSVAPTLGVSHFLIFKQTLHGLNLRLARVPRGPTLTFRILSYSLMKDVIHVQKKPHSPSTELQFSPLVVMNNFSSADNHMRLQSAMFQSLFPSIDLNSIQLKNCRRVVLLNYDKENDLIEFRHYLVTLSPVGLNRNIKRVIKGKLADLSKLEDISGLISNTAALSSDSEADDGPDTRVTLAEEVRGRGNRAAQKSAVRLKELGPRMQLQCIKITQDLMGGFVIYNKFQNKTPEEVEALKAKRKAEAMLKQRRKAEQARNVERKERAKLKMDAVDSDDDEVLGEDSKKSRAGDSDDDDEAYYRAEVGEQPEQGMFDKPPPNKKRKTPPSSSSSSSSSSSKSKFQSKQTANKPTFGKKKASSKKDDKKQGYKKQKRR